MSWGTNGRDGLNLIQNVRRGGIGNSQDQGARRRRRFLGAAQVVDAGAGRVGNRKAVAQVALPIERRVERQVVKEAVRSDDEMLDRREVARNGRDRLRVELAQVLVGSLQQSLLECAHVLRPEAEFRQLEARQLEDAAQRRSFSRRGPRRLAGWPSKSRMVRLYQLSSPRRVSTSTLRAAGCPLGPSPSRRKLPVAGEEIKRLRYYPHETP